MAARRLPPDAWALIAVAVVVVLANVLYLLDFADPNPLGPRSGLMASLAGGRAGGASTIDPNIGYSSQALGHLAALSLLKLHLPWWNPFAGTGMPLLGETQSAAFFPPTLLTAISNGQLYEHMLFELVAGIATYLLLRRLAVVRWAAAAGAIAFALNGTFAWLGHATVNPVALLPVLLLGVELAYAAARDGRRGGWWLLAVSGALSVYAGFPEVAYIDALMGLAWFGWRCTCLERLALSRFALKGAAGALAGALLAAPMLVAMADYFNHADLGTHANSTLGSDRLGADALPQLVLPYVYGPIFGATDAHGQLPALWSVVGGYLSSALVFFGLLGALSPGRRGLRALLLVWGALVFARIYGEPPLLDHVLGVFPGMAEVAFFRYGTTALELTAVILAALGLDAVARGPDRRRTALAVATTLAVVIAAAVGGRTLVDSLGTAFAHRPYYALAVAWGVVIPVSAAALALTPRIRARTPLMAAILAVDALALFAAPEMSAPAAVRLDLAPVAYLVRHLGDARVFGLGPLAPNYGSYFGVASLNVNDLPPTRFAKYVSDRLDRAVNPGLFVGNMGGQRSVWAPSPTQELLRNLAGYREAAVRYVLTEPGRALPRRPFTLVYRSPSTWVYRLSGAEDYFSAAQPACRLTPHGRERLDVRCPTATEIVRRETYFRGWTARADGRTLPIRPYDGLFQAVTLPAGAHTLTFSFIPPNEGWAALAFMAGCVALIVPTARRRGSAGSS